MEIKIYQNIMSANDAIAKDNLDWFSNKGILAINIIGSPGCGKSSLIMKTVSMLEAPVQVIEGDVASSIDAQRMIEAGIPAVQINTGGACHLDANMIKGVLNSLDVADNAFLFIENVGNLICPAEFDVGEHFKVGMLSVPEGADKPYKYPGLFTKADVVLLNKADLIPYIGFDRDMFVKGIRALNPAAPIFEVSALTGEGMDKWIRWLRGRMQELSLS